MKSLKEQTRKKECHPLWSNRLVVKASSCSRCCWSSVHPIQRGWFCNLWSWKKRRRSRYTYAYSLL